MPVTFLLLPVSVKLLPCTLTVKVSSICLTSGFVCTGDPIVNPSNSSALSLVALISVANAEQVIPVNTNAAITADTFRCNFIKISLSYPA